MSRKNHNPPEVKLGRIVTRPKINTIRLDPWGNPGRFVLYYQHQKTGVQHFNV